MFLRGNADLAGPLHDTVLKRYRVAAGSARPLRDYLPLRDFSIIHDYRLPRDPSAPTTFPSFTTTAYSAIRHGTDVGRWGWGLPRGGAAGRRGAHQRLDVLLCVVVVRDVVLHQRLVKKKQPASSGCKKKCLDLYLYFATGGTRPLPVQIHAALTVPSAGLTQISHTWLHAARFRGAAGGQH